MPCVISTWDDVSGAVTSTPLPGAFWASAGVIITDIMAAVETSAKACFAFISFCVPHNLLSALLVPLSSSGRSYVRRGAASILETA